MTPPTADRHLLRVLETVRRDLLPLCEAVARMPDDARADRAHEPRDGSQTYRPAVALRNRVGSWAGWVVVTLRKARAALRRGGWG